MIIAADGLRSQTRSLILHKSAVEVVDTGWGGWVAWADADSDTDLAEELWGAGFFVGSYPVLGRLGVIVCGPAALTRHGSTALVNYVQRQLDHPEGRTAGVLDAITEADDRYYWALTDCWHRRWHDSGVGAPAGA